MKFVTYILIVSIALSLSCGKRDHTVLNNQVILISNDVIGKWSISSFTDSGIDKTNQVSMLTLQFNSDGAFLILSADSIISGGWLILPDISIDQLQMTVSSSKLPYSIFDRHWYAIEKTNTSLGLSDVSITANTVLRLARI